MDETVKELPINRQPTIIFNISGGNIQILPTALKAEQHFHGNGFTASPAISSQQEPPQPANGHPTEIRLAIYINNVSDRLRYVSQLRACQSAAEVGRTVVQMVQESAGLTIDTAKTEPFISILLQLATGVTTGTTVANFRKAIENAWYGRKD